MVTIFRTVKTMNLRIHKLYQRSSNYQDMVCHLEQNSIQPVLHKINRPLTDIIKKSKIEWRNMWLLRKNGSFL